MAKKKDKKCAGRSRLQNVIIIVTRGYYLSSRFGLKTNEFSMNACLCTPLVFRDGYIMVFYFPAIICLNSKESPDLPRNWHAHIFAQSTPAAQRVSGCRRQEERARRGYILLFCGGKQFVIPGANDRAFVFVRLVGIVYNYHASVGIAR